MDIHLSSSRHNVLEVTKYAILAALAHRRHGKGLSQLWCLPLQSNLAMPYIGKAGPKVIVCGLAGKGLVLFLQADSTKPT